MKKLLALVTAITLLIGLSLNTNAEQVDAPSPLPKYNTESTTTSKETKTATTTPKASTNEKQELPKTQTLMQQSQSSFAPLKINADENTPIYVKLYKYNGETKKYDETPTKTLFIRGGESLQISVSRGSYIIKYCSGTTWYGEEKMFGDNGTYSKLDNQLHFATADNGYELTLKLVKNGNVTSTKVNKNDF